LAFKISKGETAMPNSHQKRDALANETTAEASAVPKKIPIDTAQTRDAAFEETLEETIAAKPEFEKSWAILIGVDAYTNRIPGLTTAANDAIALKEVLEAYHQYQVKLLTDQQATYDSILALFDPKTEGCWANQVGPNDRVLFYFAGHGIAEQGEDGPAGYLLPQNADPKNPADTFLEMTKLHDLLIKLECRHMLVILDCCFAGAMRWSTMRVVQVPPKEIHRQRYEHFVKSPAWQLLTSAAYNQKALDIINGKVYSKQRVIDNNQKHSPFAQALIDALSKEVADVFPPGRNGEATGDGLLTAYELYQYIEETVWYGASEVNHNQTPELWPLKKHRNGQYVFLVPGRMLNLPDAEKLTLGQNPYRGLHSFEPNHYDIFFGRQRVIKNLVQTITRNCLTIVLGASGTGKSSLVKAGALPVLQDLALLEPEQRAGQSVQSPEVITLDPSQWRVLSPIVPTKSPLAELARLLQDELGADPAQLYVEPPGGLARIVTDWAHHYPNQKLVLTIDQFEEMITVCRSNTERAQFLELLVNVLRTQPNRFRLVLTLRTDFEPQLAELALKPYWEPSRFIVPPMNQTELREAIEGPASVRVLYFEPPALVERLVEEVNQTPGALPLLSFALSEMYMHYVNRQSDNRAITLADYKALGGDEARGGGVIGALRNRANQEYDRLAQDFPAEAEAYQATMRRIMLRMVAIEGGELARRRVPRPELVYPDTAENQRVETVLGRLLDARLIVGGKSEGEPYVEPAHDALVWAWDKLLLWKQEAEEYLPLQRRLTQVANEWAQAEERAKIGLLWNNNPRLPQLQAELAPELSPDSQFGNFLRDARHTLWPPAPTNGQLTWLNQLETEFVRHSIVRRSTVLKRIVGITLAVIIALSGLTLFAFDRQKQAVAAEATAVAERNEAQRQSRQSRAEQLAASTNAVIADEIEPSGSLALLLAREAVLATEPDGYTLINAEAALRNAIEAAPPWRLTLPRHRHTAPILAIAYSPDGRTFATASGGNITQRLTRDQLADNTVRLWNAETGQQMRLFHGHLGPVNALAFSPHGEMIATASADSLACLWDVQSGAQIGCFEGHGDDVLAVSFLADSTGIVTASADRTARLWNVPTRQQIREFDGHADRVNAVTISPDGTRLVTASSDQTACLWDLSSGQQQTCYTGHADAVLAAAFGSAGATVVTGSADATTHVWDAATLEVIHILVDENAEYTKAVTALAVSPAGDSILTASSDGFARLWDAASGELHRTFRAAQSLHSGGVTAVAFHPNGQTMLTATDMREVRQWQVSSGEEIPLLEGHTDSIRDVAYSPDGEMIATADWDGMARLWDAKSGRKIRRLEGHTQPLNVVAFSPSGELLLTASDDGTARLWNVTTGEELHRLEKHTSSIQAAAFTRDGKQVVTLSMDGTARIWDVMTGEQVDLFQQDNSRYDLELDLTILPTGQMVAYTYGFLGAWLWDIVTGETLLQIQRQGWQIYSVTFSPDGETLVITEGGGTDRFLEVATGREIGTFVSTAGSIRDVAFSPDGKTFTTASFVSQVRDTKTREVIHNLAGFGHTVVAVAYSPDGENIAIASDDGTVRVWDAISIAQRQRFDNHPGEVLSTGFSPDGKAILTASGSVFRNSDEYTAHIWDITSGVELQRFIGHTDTVNMARFDPTGAVVVTASDDGTSRLWDVSTGREVKRLDHPYGVVSAVFSPDGRYILTASGGRFQNPEDGDGVAYMWDAQGGQQVQRYEGHAQPLTSAIFSPDGKMVFTGSWDNTARLWDAESAEQLRVFEGHSGGDQAVIQAVAFSPSGDMLATAGGWEDGTVRIWDEATGWERLRIDTLEVPATIYSLAFSPDGRYLLISHNSPGTYFGAEHRVRIWNVETGEEVRQLAGHSESVYWAEYSPDGRTVVTASGDGSARLWHDVETLLETAGVLIQREPPLLTQEERQRYGLD
jgi:WD40 repeat protein